MPKLLWNEYVTEINFNRVDTCKIIRENVMQMQKLFLV